MDKAVSLTSEVFETFKLLSHVTMLYDARPKSKLNSYTDRLRGQLCHTWTSMLACWFSFLFGFVFYLQIASVWSVASLELYSLQNFWKTTSFGLSYWVMML